VTRYAVVIRISVSAKFDGLFGKMFEDHIQRATA
jgi:hypothetical protein